MKQFCILLCSIFFSTWVFAEGNPVGQFRNVYSSTNVTTGAWVTLFSSIPYPVSTIEIFDSSGQTLEIGIGAAGSEIVQLIVLPGGNGPIRYNAPTGARLSIKALSGTANTGELDVNLYN